jgi:hypothetical protein
MTTKPGRAPSDYRPKASVIETQRKAAQEAERIRIEEAKAAAVNAESVSVPEPDEPTYDSGLIADGISSKKVAAKLTLLAVLLVGLIVGSIVMFFNNLVMPAVLTLVVTAVTVLGLSIWLRSRYTTLVNELGRNETIDLLLSVAEGKDTSKNS